MFIHCGFLIDLLFKSLHSTNQFIVFVIAFLIIMRSLYYISDQCIAYRYTRLSQLVATHSTWCSNRRCVQATLSQKHYSISGSPTRFCSVNARIVLLKNSFFLAKLSVTTSIKKIHRSWRYFMLLYFPLMTFTQDYQSWTRHQKLWHRLYLFDVALTL